MKLVELQSQNIVVFALSLELPIHFEKKKNSETQASINFLKMGLFICISDVIFKKYILFIT